VVRQGTGKYLYLRVLELERGLELVLELGLELVLVLVWVLELGLELVLELVLKRLWGQESLLHHFRTRNPYHLHNSSFGGDDSTSNHRNSDVCWESFY
jgi:hypothetical protein